ncbi:MAG: glycerate kinase [Alphaproteobacteria bacterium]|nr:glycerate kinase [Alphaproteobacteria bacterium]
MLPGWPVGKSPLDVLRQLYDRAVERALPGQAMAAWLPPAPRGRTVVIGAGKAAASMAHALDDLWPADAPLSGLVVTRYHHTPARQLACRIEVVEAAHPVPDAAGLDAAERMLNLVQGLGPDDLVVCLISGGGSSLLTLPAQGLSLADKQAINRQLLESGANITEMNCVRKHLSRIKGGRLAQACGSTPLVTLAISDVPGDDPSVIASGPTVPDESTCADALALLERYRILVPSPVLDALSRGELETPKPGPDWQHRRVHMVATPMQSLQAAADMARGMGLAAHVLSDEIEGESSEVARVHAALARAVARGDGPFKSPCVLLSGGETTVTVKPLPQGWQRGQGGRAGEFCLGLALGLQGQQRVWGLAADTDGIDGMGLNAGARVGPDTLARARSLGLKAPEALARNDALGFFTALDDLVVTGPTYTNVNDFRAILIL